MGVINGTVREASEAFQFIKDVALNGRKAIPEMPNGAVKGSSWAQEGLAKLLNPQGKIAETINPFGTINRAAEGYSYGMGMGNSLRFAAMNDTSKKAFIEKFGERNFVEEFANHDKAGALQKELDSFFDEAKYDHVRTGIAAVTLGSTAYRVASGGGLYRDSDGNFNIIGIPGI
jgi:hypothetical protein